MQSKHSENYAEVYSFQTTYRRNRYIATCQLNEGNYGILGVFNALGMQLGPTYKYVAYEKKKRIKDTNKHAEQNTKEPRKARRHEKNVSADGVEGTLYILESMILNM